MEGSGRDSLLKGGWPSTYVPIVSIALCLCLFFVLLFSDHCHQCFLSLVLYHFLLSYIQSITLNSHPYSVSAVHDLLLQRWIPGFPVARLLYYPPARLRYLDAVPPILMETAMTVFRLIIGGEVVKCICGVERVLVMAESLWHFSIFTGAIVVILLRVGCLLTCQWGLLAQLKLKLRKCGAVGKASAKRQNFNH